jgi:succinate-acetate transporter protein
MMNDKPVVDASSFGAIGFGFSLFLLAFYMAQILDINALGMVLATGLFAGGLVPFIAGLWALKTGNTLGATTFILGATFWFSYAFITILPALGIVPSVAEPAIVLFVQVPFFFLWGFLAFWLFLSSMKTNRILQAAFFVLAIFYWLVAFGYFHAWDTWRNTTVIDFTLVWIAGWIGVIAGFLILYYGLATVLNKAYQREIMPLGKVQSAD